MAWSLVGTIPGTGSGGSGWTDAYAFALELAVADANTAPTEVLAMFADAAYADTQTIPGEAVEFGISGPLDTNAAPTDARTSLVTRWATTNTTSGTAPTSPTSAHGARDGTTATVKAGGLANGTSTLNLNIVAPFGEIAAGATRSLIAHYATTAGATDTFTAQVSYRKVGQGSNTTAALPTTGNFLTTPATVSLTNIDPTVSVVVTFTHAALTPATGGNIAVDAVGIETTGAL